MYPDKVVAIRKWKPSDLTSRSQVKSFLGLINFIRLFCEHASEIERPLSRLTKKGVEFKIGKEEAQAMEKLQAMATEAPVLTFFDPARDTTLETDASSEAVGAALFQTDERGRQQPVGFFSKTMSPAETCYPIQDRELLAVVRGVEFWRPELTATPFTVLTDHEALKYFTTKRQLSTRQANWAQILSDFNYRVRYRPGKENLVADALSRKSEGITTVKAKREAERVG